MPASAVLDNDVLVKCSCYKVLKPLIEYLGPAVVLGEARYVVTHRLESDPAILDRGQAMAHWREAQPSFTEIEPTAEEIELALSIEESATRLHLTFDVGESVLCAVLLARRLNYILTGDKRAIASMPALSSEITAFGDIAGRVVCLEQILLGLMHLLGIETLKLLVCAERGVDRAASICFSCYSEQGFEPAALHSYIDDLREESAGALVQDFTLA